MTRGEHIWTQVQLALLLLALDPQGLNGAVFRVRAGPVRDRLLCMIRMIAGQTTRLHPNMNDEQFYGGVDVVATLANGRLSLTTGLLQRSGWFELTMAERVPLQTAARLCQAMDQGMISPFIALDEGVDGEAVPQSLRERLAFYFDLSDLHHSDTDLEIPEGAAGTELASASVNDMRALSMLAESFGISSMRAPLLALNVAKANAMANTRASVEAEDLEIGAELVFPSRATQIPQASDVDDPPPPPQNDTAGQDEGDPSSNSLDLPNEMLIEAVKALLPADFLETLKLQKSRAKAAGIGFGTQTKSKTRGRPKPPRKGKLDGQNRIDVVATLRTAAPFQTIRRAHSKTVRQVLIYPDDIHVKRYETRSERVVIFAVDASGSAALARLSEAKGAVELLLAQAYARRDHVALIGFRNAQADLLLPRPAHLFKPRGGSPNCRAAGAPLWPWGSRPQENWHKNAPLRVKPLWSLS